MSWPPSGGVSGSAVNLDSEKGLILDTQGHPFSTSNPAFPKNSRTQSVDMRQIALSPFDMQSIYGDGQVFSAAAINAAGSAYVNGIPGLFERVVGKDNRLCGSNASVIPDVYMNAWRLYIKGSHKVTFGRPRSQIVSRPLEFKRQHFIYMRVALNNPGSRGGWGSRDYPNPIGAFFGLSQQGDPNGIQYSEGQPAAGSSPFYITIKGTTLIPEVRSISETMGMRRDQPGFVHEHEIWLPGDTEHVVNNNHEARTLFGARFHTILLDFYMDDLHISDGGRGYIKAWFDGKLWFHHIGATSCPRNAEGQYIPYHARLGLYETSSGTLADNTLCSTVPSCNLTDALSRSMDIAAFSIRSN